MTSESDSAPAPRERSPTLAWATGLLLTTMAFFVVGLGVYVFLRSGDAKRTLRLAPSDSATFELVRASGDSRTMIDWRSDVPPETGREIAALLDGSTALAPDGEWVVGLRWPPIEYVESPGLPGLYFPDPYPEDALFVIDDPASGESKSLSVVMVAPRYAHVSDFRRRYRVLDSKKRRLFALLQPLIEKAESDAAAQ